MNVTEEKYQELINLGSSLSEKVASYLDKKPSLFLKQNLYQLLTEKNMFWEVDNYSRLKNMCGDFASFLELFNSINDLLKEIALYSQRERILIANSFIIPDIKDFYHEVEEMKKQGFSDTKIIEMISKEYGLPRQIVMLKLMEIRLSQKEFGKIVFTTSLHQNRQKR